MTRVQPSDVLKYLDIFQSVFQRRFKDYRKRLHVTVVILSVRRQNVFEDK
jgi:hypothetical protein